jgi:hypothetical protein
MTPPSKRERGLSQKIQDEGWRDAVGGPRESELAVLAAVVHYLYAQWWKTHRGCQVPAAKAKL